VTGADGQVGRWLVQLSGQNSRSRIEAYGRADLDIADAESVSRVLAGTGPGDVVINTAAYTAVDAAESDVAGARAGNEVGPRNLAVHTARTGARLIHISTDYVFSGDPAQASGPDGYDIDDPVAPATVYGRTKLDGERAVAAADPRATIVRTAWVYTGAAGGRDFVATMRRLESERETVSVVTDQIGSPTYAADLAVGLLELAGALRVEDRPGGMLHAAGGGRTSWFDLARAVFQEVGADPDRVLPCGSADFPRPAPRPAYSVLSGRSWSAAGLSPLRGWREALAAAVTLSA